MTRRAPQSGTAGYTLVELLVVLAIMGFLAVAAVPLLSASRPGLDVRAAANAIAQDLRLTRQAAIDSGGGARLVLDPKAHRYVRLPGGKPCTLPKDIALAVTGPAQGEIDFYPDGSTSGGTVTVTAAHTKHRVTVRWPSGEIVLDD